MEAVGKVYGKGNSNSKNKYNLKDTGPHKGVSYYRLKQTDLNGDVSYSPLVTVNFNDNRELSYRLFPNPSKGEFTIQGVNNDDIEVSIYNALGQKIDYTINSKSDGALNIDCASLATGIYFVTLKNEGVSSNHKLIIE